jgi:hypothetical protein
MLDPRLRGFSSKLDLPWHVLEPAQTIHSLLDDRKNPNRPTLRWGFCGRGARFDKVNAEVAVGVESTLNPDQPICNSSDALDVLVVFVFDESLVDEALQVSFTAYIHHAIIIGHPTDKMLKDIFDRELTARIRHTMLLPMQSTRDNTPARPSGEAFSGATLGRGWCLW